MIGTPQDKRQFYARPEVAGHYDEQRFGGASGAWVNAREIELALSLVPPFKRALDLGCGTGRLSRALATCGETVGLDTSFAMLEQTGPVNGLARIQGDGFALPFASESYDVAIALRVMFHFTQPDKLLTEMRRVVKPGGSLIFDTYLWSPRAWLPLDATRWGSGVIAHPPAQIAKIAQELDMQVADQVHCFLFSPYLYRRLPLPVVKTLGRIEDQVPPQMRARVFWRLVRGA